METVLKFQIKFFHDVVVQRLILSHGHPNGIFCECTWKPSSLVRNKMLCITVLIRETFNVKIMLNMLRINIVYWIRTKALIEFCLHIETLHVYWFFYITIRRMCVRTSTSDISLSGTFKILLTSQRYDKNSTVTQICHSQYRKQRWLHKPTYCD